MQIEWKRVIAVILVLLGLSALIYFKFFNKTENSTIKQEALNKETNTDVTVTSTSAVEFESPTEPSSNAPIKGVAMLGVSGIFNFIVQSEDKYVKLVEKPGLENPKLKKELYQIGMGDVDSAKQSMDIYRK